MAHDVFISHSSKDAEAAQKLCEIFEKNELKCWIAPRDVRPGYNYDEEIVEGIENTKIFILLISKDSNLSEHVHRELHIAAENGNAIFPVRIEDIIPSKKLKYFLSGKNWTDAFQPNYTKSINNLISVVKNLVGINLSNPENNHEVEKNLIFQGLRPIIK